MRCGERARSRTRVSRKLTAYGRGTQLDERTVAASAERVSSLLKRSKLSQWETAWPRRD
jgi:hypothetical protein